MLVVIGAALFAVILCTLPGREVSMKEFLVGGFLLLASIVMVLMGLGVFSR